MCQRKRVHKGSIFKLKKGIDGSSVFLGGSACATGSVYEAADASHLEQFVLVGSGNILIDLGQQFGSHSLLYGFEHSERVCDGGLPDADHFALL